MVSRPPSSGAITGATRPGHTTYAITRGMSVLAALAITTSLPTGTIIAPPTPCATRMATSWPSPALSAQPREARVNTAIAVRNTRRAPKRAVSQPLSGISTARVNR
ncbi:hypothetical protein KALB_4995 [Kutzneria albida DSM 43870]|uniref:Uncharacterized protein n=1 Tax=Kutzneria albida DSM 43870 TaxID=1449976 RepID=W5WBT7_9PSEU|nr:hypothetical protein KALB_4995 [Kutzneria albida DSM 43870]